MGYLRIDSTIVAQEQIETGFRSQRNAGPRPGKGAPQHHEAATGCRNTDQMVIGLLKRNGYLGPPDRQRQHEPAPWFELFTPRRQNVRGADGEDDAVVRRVRRVAEA